MTASRKDDEESSNDNESHGSSAQDESTYANYPQYQQSNNVTPRSLLNIMRLTFCLFAIMLTISAVNMGIIMNNQSQSKVDIFSVKYAYDRMQYLVAN